MTNDDFEAHLRECGYAVEMVTGGDGAAYIVVHNVELPRGPFRGIRCDIAIQRNEMVPYVPPAAIHTRPHLAPMDTSPPLHTQQSLIGGDWQYWSRRFDRQPTPTPRGLWAHILTVLTDPALEERCRTN